MKRQNSLCSKDLVFFWGFCFIVLLGAANYSQAQTYKSSAFCDGEWLKYKVKWKFIRLGTIEIFQEKIADTTPPAFRVRMRAKSAKLPFIKVYFVNEGILNPYSPELQHFTITVGKQGDNITTYAYDQNSRSVLMKKIDKEQVVRLDSLVYADKLYDAIGTFMMMRCLSASTKDTTLVNVINFQITQTHLSFNREEDSLKVASSDKKQKAWKFSGHADFMGEQYAGVSGPFEGWISQDSSAVPLKVKVKIFLGSVTIELEDFRRVSSIDKSVEDSITRSNQNREKEDENESVPAQKTRQTTKFNHLGAARSPSEN